MHHLLLHFSIKVMTFPKHRLSYRDKTTQLLKNHEAFSYTQNLNQKGTKNPRHFPNGNQTHPHILLCYDPTAHKKPWFKFVSLIGILLSSSLSILWKLPLEMHRREHRNLAKAEHTGWAPAASCVPIRMSDARDVISHVSQWPGERSGEAGLVLSPRLSWELGAPERQPQPSPAAEAAPCCLLLLWSTQRAAALFCRRALALQFPRMVSVQKQNWKHKPGIICW